MAQNRLTKVVTPESPQWAPSMAFGATPKR